MDIGEAEAFGVKRMRLDESPYLIELGHIDFAQRIQFHKLAAAVVKRAESYFGDDEGMHDNPAGVEKTNHLRITPPQMVDPD